MIITMLITDHYVDYDDYYDNYDDYYDIKAETWTPHRYIVEMHKAYLSDTQKVFWLTIQSVKCLLAYS